jgi:predicted enzyme related to lactoylglutathione lyase
LIKGNESQFSLRSIAWRRGKTNMDKSDGRFVWYELATTHVETAKAFYSSVVGWDTADAPTPGSNYTIFTAGGVPVAGLTKLQAGPQKTGVVPPQWRGYVGVDDVDAATRRAKKLGGTVHVPPPDVPGVSRFSVIADPQRATLALIERREAGQEQSQQPDGPGHVVWRELIAIDLERAFIFYNKLLGWQKAGATPSPVGSYQEFSAGADTIGGMFGRFDGAAYSLWLYYFSVGDIEAAAKQVAALGGKTICGPLTVAGAARIIQCEDPQGAVFGLMDRRVHIAIGCYSARDPLKKQ